MEDDSCIIQLKNNVIIRILICMLQLRSDYGCGMMSSIHFLPPPIRKATSSDKSRVGRPSGALFSRAALTEEC